MKKFLSLVLALVMTMSLVTVASAAEYKDDSSIKYEEAVAVISGAGIVGGYADGTFNPTGTLTRQAAAKILCNLTLGTTAADALGTSTAPYKDVPADSQFGGYIAYCAQMGYISGYADGTFRPTGTLTGFAFLKMLECALGYDQTIEGLVGTNWAVNVARLALEKDLIDGNDAFVGSKPITREEACLYALNTLEARPVKYDSKGTNITTTDGTVVNVGATTAEADPNFGTLAAKCQKKLTGLTAYGFDNFDGPSRTVKFDGKEIGTFSKTADKVYTGEVTHADLYKDFGLDSFTNTVYQYGIDGQTQTTNGTTPFAITKGDDDTKVGADGALTYVYKTYNPGTGAFTGLQIVTHNIYGKKITAVSKNTSGDRIVKMAGSLEFKTEDFAKNDIVFVTLDKSEATADQVQTMVLAEKQTGKIEKINSKDYTIDGTKLKKVNDNGATIAVGNEVEYYVCEAGTIAYMVVVNSTADVSTLAYVEDCGSNRGNYAVLRFADGTKKTVDTDKDYYVNGELKYYIVKVSETTSGEYKLTAKSDISTAATLNASTAYTNGKTAPTSGITSIAVDNNTVFLYKTGTTYKQYVGKDNAPSFANTYAIASYTNTGVDSAAAFVYVDVNGSVTTPSSKLTVIAFKDSTKVTYDKDDVTYYEYKAIVDGEVSTLKVDTSKWAELYSYNYDDGYAGYLAVTAYQTDANGVATWQLADELPVVGNRDVKVSNGVIYVAGGAYAYTDDAVVYFVDNDSHKVSVGTIDDVLEDDAYSGGDLNPYGFASVKTNSNGKVTAVVLGVNP